ncbi:MAG: cyclic nucleotide-binding domain-containing protein [Proteobacteria bacterium]|nr:cyclic nucleotide-binding domain-containing protein [Pseudomonadota bacterium]
MKRAAQRLKRNPDLAMLSDLEATALLTRASELRFDKGDVLLRSGDIGESMIVIGTGTVEVKQGDRTLATLDPGATIGEMGLLDPAPRSATVVATATVIAYEITREQLWAMLAEGDSGAVKMLQGLTATVCARLEGVNKLVQEEVVRPKGNVFSRIWKKVSAKGRK